MTSEEIKNMSFEDFRTQIEGMEEVQKLTADGTERYGIYKHDVCYVNRDGIERTLQMIVPETNAKAPRYIRQFCMFRDRHGENRTTINGLEQWQILQDVDL